MFTSVYLQIVISVNEIHQVELTMIWLAALMVWFRQGMRVGSQFQLDICMTKMVTVGKLQAISVLYS